MRRRSRLEARQQAEARSNPVLRYLFFGALVLLSLALPAVLTLTLRSIPSSIPKEGGVENNSLNSAADGGVENDSWDALHWRGISPRIPSSPRSIDDLHVVFSTDCSAYQNFQAIVLFHSAEVRRKATKRRDDRRLTAVIWFLPSLSCMQPFNHAIPFPSTTLSKRVRIPLTHWQLAALAQGDLQSPFPLQIS